MAGVWTLVAAVAVSVVAVGCSPLTSPFVKVHVEAPNLCHRRPELELRWNETRSVQFNYALRQYTVDTRDHKGVVSSAACRQWCLDGRSAQWSKRYQFSCIMYKYYPRERRCVLVTSGKTRSVGDTRTGVWDCHLKENLYYLPMEDIIDHVDSATNVKSHILLGHRINGTLKGEAQLVRGKVGQGLKLSVHPINVLFGNRAKECFGNLGLCFDGLTIAMWTKERREEERMTYGRIFHSNSVTVYLVRGRFFAVFQTPRRMWSVAAPLHDGNHEHDGWHHVILTWHREKGLKLFIDGHLKKESKGEFWEEGAAGKLTNGSSIGSPSPHKNGSVVVDEVRFWNASMERSVVAAIFEWETRPRLPHHVLKGDEVKAMTGFPTAPGMKYYLPMDRMEKNRVIGDGINGTAHGPVKALRNSGHRTLSFYPNSFLNLGDRHSECFGNVDLCFRGFSMSLWVMMSSSAARYKSSRYNKFYPFTSGGRYPSVIVTMEYGKIEILVQSPRMRKYWSASHSITTHDRRSRWVHVAFSWSPRGMRSNFNGREPKWYKGAYLQRALKIPGAKEVTAMGLRYIRRDKHSRRPKGGEAVDQVRFWQRTLSEREINGIYNAEMKVVTKNTRKPRRRRSRPKSKPRPRKKKHNRGHKHHH